MEAHFVLDDKGQPALHVEASDDAESAAINLLIDTLGKHRIMFVGKKGCMNENAWIEFKRKTRKRNNAGEVV